MPTANETIKTEDNEDDMADVDWKMFGTLMLSDIDVTEGHSSESDECYGMDSYYYLLLLLSFLYLIS